MGYAGGVDNIVTIVIWVYLVTILALFIGFYWKASTSKYNPSLRQEDKESKHALSARGFWTRRYLGIMLIIMAVIAFLIIVYLSRKYILKRVRQAKQEGAMLSPQAMQETDRTAVQAKKEGLGSMSSLSEFAVPDSQSSGSDSASLNLDLGSSSSGAIRSDELFSGQSSNESLSSVDESIFSKDLESFESLRSSPWGEERTESLYTLSSISTQPDVLTDTNQSVPTETGEVPNLPPMSIQSNDLASLSSWHTNELAEDSMLNDDSSNSSISSLQQLMEAMSESSQSRSLDSRSSTSGSSGLIQGFASSNSQGSVPEYSASSASSSLASASSASASSASSSLASASSASSSLASASSASSSLASASSASSGMGSHSSYDSLFTSSMSSKDSLDSMSSLSSVELPDFPPPPGMRS
jgi:hypothetical protein